MIEFTGFTSTSTSLEIAANYQSDKNESILSIKGSGSKCELQAVLYMWIPNSKKTKARNIKRYSSSNEDEVLFGRNTVVKPFAHIEAVRLNEYQGRCSVEKFDQSQLGDQTQTEADLRNAMSKHVNKVFQYTPPSLRKIQIVCLKEVDPELVLRERQTKPTGLLNSRTGQVWGSKHAYPKSVGKLKEI